MKEANVSPGYYNKPNKTKKAFTDGWFRTGDFVEIDSTGNMYFTGRKDDAIVRANELNIYPEDIESVLKSFTRSPAL